MKDKKWKVECSEGFMKEYDKVPQEVTEKFEEFVKGLKEGKIDPTKIGHKLNLDKCKKQLLCGDCGSKSVSWMIDKTDKEVYFNCNSCGESFWMTEKEYKKAIKENKECIIN